MKHFLLLTTLLLANTFFVIAQPETIYSFAFEQAPSSTTNITGVEAGGTIGGTFAWNDLVTAPYTFSGFACYKLNSDEAYLKLTLAEGTFEKNDTLTIDCAGGNAEKSYMAVYADVEHTLLLASTPIVGEKSTRKVLSAVLPDLANGLSSIYLFRNNGMYFYGVTVAREITDTTGTTVKTPVISFDNQTNLASVSCATDSVTIYYTTDGSTPTTESAQYEEDSKIAIKEACTVNVLAVRNGFTSAQTSFAISQVATPIVSEPGTANRVTFSCATQGATLYYRVGEEGAFVTGDSFVVTEDCTLYVYATKNSMFTSEIVAQTILYSPPTPAFPTAEGFGMYASGGRGGQVVEVTSLEDDANGSIVGSLRWALKQYSNEPITVVFRVSGIIQLVADLKCKRTAGITLAGQTAPGDGICIRGGKVNFGGSSNVIIRHLRFRLGVTDAGEFIAGGSFGYENGSNFIIDHCTFGWSAEENMTVYDDYDYTIQWCLLHEGLYDAGHQKGERSYACQWGGQTCTFHHNLLAHNVSRTPRINGARSNDLTVLYDYVNNVNYNWGKRNSAYGGDFEATGKWHRANWVNNYYKPGPAFAGTKYSYFVQSSFNSAQDTSQVAQWYMNGNYMEGTANATNNTNNTNGLDASYYTAKGVSNSRLIATVPFEVPYPVNTETAQEAYRSVLAGAGAFPRDTVDRRIVNEVRSGKATFGGTYSSSKLGIIDSQFDVEGYPEYLTYNEITDADHDGMDDAWEVEHGFSPADASDRNYTYETGYTALEVYLNSLAGEETPTTTFVKSETVKLASFPLRDGTVIFNEPTSYILFNVRGCKLQEEKEATCCLLRTLPKGLYLLQTRDRHNKTELCKLLW